MDRFTLHFKLINNDFSLFLVQIILNFKMQPILCRLTLPDIWFHLKMLHPKKGHNMEENFGVWWSFLDSSHSPYAQYMQDMHNMHNMQKKEGSWVKEGHNKLPLCKRVGDLSERDNFNTTLKQLWYNFQTTLRQLWNNSDTTLKNFETILIQQGEKQQVATLQEGGGYSRERPAKRL